MKRSPNGMSFRTKLLLGSGLTILLAVSIVTGVLTYKAAQMLLGHMRSNLELLTEQSLRNFQSETEAIQRQLMSQMTGKMVPDHMYMLRDMSPGEIGYSEKARGLVAALNQTISPTCGYDRIYVKLCNGVSFSSTVTFADSFVEEASLLLSGEYGEKTYGVPRWTRSDNGTIYLVRDVYNLEPFQFVGKAIVRVREELFVSLGSHVQAMNCAVAFLDETGEAITAGGTVVQGMLEAAAEAASMGAKEIRLGETYDLSIQKGDGWTAVGMMPRSSLNGINHAVVRMGIVASLVALALSSAAVIIITRRMTRQMSLLVSSMDEVTAGNLDLTVPICSSDETGQMSAHFNTMIGRMRELMKQVVQEENSRNRAEYDALEYKYRSLQSQISPHFIYNALEVVNAMGKLNGSDEICKVVRYISMFLRQNTRNMEKRFIPVRCELDSLSQYAHIYGYIYGNILSTPFSMEPGTEEALIPTMILQPVLENALVYGVRSEHSVVALTVQKTPKGDLCLTVEDNGAGMPPEMVEKILGGEAQCAPDTKPHPSSGVGVRNVRDRLALIYGERMRFEIDSVVSRGTRVRITVPLVYDEEELSIEPKGNERPA